MTKRQSSNPFRSFFAATVLFLLTGTCHCARIRCGVPSDGDMDKPKLADCRRVLIHLPSIASNTLRTSDIRFLKTAPFYPPLNVRHGTCQVAIGWHSGRLYGSPVGRHRRDVPMDQLWGEMRDATERIVADCVEHDQMGNASGELVYEDTDYAPRWSVLVWNPGDEQDVQNGRFERQRERLSHIPNEEISLAGHVNFGSDTFITPLYEV